MVLITYGKFIYGSDSQYELPLDQLAYTAPQR